MFSSCNSASGGNMSLQAFEPGGGARAWIRTHALTLAIALVIGAVILLDQTGVWKIIPADSGKVAAWLLVGLGFFIVIDQLFTGQDTVPSITWAAAAGYLIAATILLTALAQGSEPGPKLWALSLGIFACITTALTLTLRARPVPWLTGALIIAVAAAAAATATIVVPVVRARPDLWIFAIAAFVGSSITLLLLLLNERIYEKRHRIMQSLLDDLAVRRAGIEQGDIALLKMAAHKYGTKLRNGAPLPAEAAAQSNAGGPAEARWPLFLAASAYLAFSVVGYVLLFTPICVVFGVDVGPGTAKPACSASWISSALIWTAAEKVDFKDLITTVGIAGVAFLGAHLFTLRYLFKAALNSELNQFKWIRGALHLLTGVVIGVILYRALKDTGWLAGAVTSYAAALWFGVAFASGWIPDFALGTLFRHLRVSNLKSVDEDVLRSAALVPIEIVDGIDYDTRFRLEENNIIDVQNLATYNPITLYVETPFGLSQIFDWILQAQLCLAVGPKGYAELRKIAIRTIFQLEDEVRDAPDNYASMIGSALFAGASPERLKAIAAAAADGGGTTPDRVDPKVVKYAVSQMCGNLYIVSLRRLYEYIYRTPVAQP